MIDTITLTGLVATEPRVISTSDGLNITSFRLASTQRRFNKAKDAWVDGETNWYTITGFRQLATNLASSINKGERVVVKGKLRIREWETGEKSGTTIEVEAEAVGHDLTWGTASYVRTTISTSTAADSGSEPTDEFPSGSSTDAVAEEQSPADTFSPVVDDAELPVPF